MEHAPSNAQITLTFEGSDADAQTRTTTTIQGSVPEVFEALEQLYGVSRVNEARREWGLQPKPEAQAEQGSTEWATQMRQRVQGLAEELAVTTRLATGPKSSS